MKKIKEMSKKAKLFLMIGILAIVTIPVLVFAAGKATVSLDIPSEVHRGETVTMKLNLLNVDEFISGGFFITYDTSIFEFQKVRGGNDTLDKSITVTGGVSSDKAGLRIGTLVTDGTGNNVSYNGELAIITFKVKEDAKGGDYDFKINVETFRKSTPEGKETVEHEVKDAKTRVFVPATDFTLTKDNITLLNGETEKINITVTPDGVYPLATPIYSVTNGDSVTVDPDGTIHANSNGKSTIKVDAYGFSKTLNVEVINPVESIRFDTNSIEMDKTESQTITATPVPHNPNAPATGNTTIVWSSSVQSVATVAGGVITPVGGGTTVIRAEIKEGEQVIAFAECTVKVVVKITNATISDESLKLIIDDAAPEKARHTLSVKIEPDDADDKSVTYESKNAGVATVNSDGEVTAIAAGKTTIIVKVNTYETFEVPVEVIVPLKSLELEDKEIEMLPTQTKKLGLTINPTNTSEKDKIKWESSEPETVEVDQEGNIKALKPGTVTITVKAIDTEYQVKETIVTVKVLTPVDNVVITPSSEFKMNKGETKTLGIDTYPKGDGVQKVTVTWESDSLDVVTVNKTTGEVEAVGVGTATVTGSVSNGSKVTAKITVENPIKNVKFEKTSTRIEIGKNETLKLIIDPSDYWYADPQKVKWTSTSDSIASVVEGVVTANSKGTVTITAEIAGKSASITVEVYVSITGIEINEAKDANSDGIIEVEKNASYKLTAKVLPEDTTESKNVTWSSSDSDAVSVNANGEITIHDVSKVVTITATASDGKTKAIVKIKGKISITNFEVSNTEMKIYKGEANAQVISTTITPTDTTESKVITWDSDDKTIAIVDSNGKVTGLKAGTANITGTLANGMKVTIHVTVEIIPLTDIEVEFPDEVLKGKETSIVVKPVPATSTEFENIEYEVEDEDILTVDANGNVKGLKAGTTTITVRVGSVEKEITVTVKEVSAEGITAFIPDNKLEVGDQANIQVKVEPEDCTDELTYKYESSDPKVATIDENGKISAVGIGKTQITVTASNGMISTFEITVTGAVVNPQTGLESYVIYMIMSIVSLLGLGTVVYTKKRFIK